VFVIDPAERAVRIHDAGPQRELREPDTLTHDTLRGFALSLTELFAELDRWAG